MLETDIIITQVTEYLLSLAGGLVGSQIRETALVFKELNIYQEKHTHIKHVTYTTAEVCFPLSFPWVSPP